MRDCPACRVPLHGYEEVCPSCGTKQAPTRGGGGRVPYGAGWKPEEPKVNMVPFIAAFVVFVGFILVAMQSTWIGAMMRGDNNKNVDPMANMTYMQARDAVDSGLQQGLTSVGATKSKIAWKAAAGGTGKPEERSMDAPVEVSVDTALSAPDQRKQVIDPIKPYMEKAKITSLVMTDSKSHATWTYNVSTPSAPAEDSE